jgi:solute:Na+ symporter, SSS family
VFQALPTGLRGLLMAGLVAAAMSTFDSTINAGASYWVRDFYQLYFNQRASEKELIRQSRAATVFLAGAGLVMALSVSNIDAIWSWITGPLSAGLFAPVLLRWYWWRFNGWGFAFSTAAGLLAALVLRIGNQAWPLYVTFPVVWSISLAAGIIVSLATEPTDHSTLINFARRIQPFGLWRAVWRFGGEKKSDRSGWFHILLTLVAICWHLSGVAGVISLVLHKWISLLISALVFLTAGAVLTFCFRRSR